MSQRTSEAEAGAGWAELAAEAVPWNGAAGLEVGLRRRVVPEASLASLVLKPEYKRGFYIRSFSLLRDIHYSR